MSVSRRSFLVGAGSIITAAFAKEAFTSDTKTPIFPQHVAWRVDEPKTVISTQPTLKKYGTFIVGSHIRRP